MFSANQICLSVGATIGRPRAFNERPYKTKSNFFMRRSLWSDLFLLIQLVRDELIDPMNVVDHEEGGNRASFDAAVGYGSAAVQRVAVFLVKSFFGKSNGARIAVDGF